MEPLEQQILEPPEPRTTDTGATSENKGYWSHERQIHETSDQYILETGATRDRYWSHKQKLQPLEPQEQQTTDTGDWSRDERQTDTGGATSDRQILVPQTTGTGDFAGATDNRYRSNRY